MHLAGFTQFSEEHVVFWLTRVLPDGFFVITYESEELIVATAIASHNPTLLHPYGGELGWVAGGSGARRSGVGSSGLQLGFVPFLFEVGIAERWQAICQKLAWPFASEAWPRTQFVGL